MRGLPTTFWYLWAGTLVNRLGGFVIPFLALYLTAERGYSVADAGLTVSLYGLGSVCSGPVGGWFADRVGRRPTMLAGLGLGGCAMLQLGLARAPLHIACSTAALGFFNDLYRPGMHAAVADLVPPAERVRAYGYIYWGVNLGFAAAAVLAGLLVRTGYLTLFVVDAATTFTFALIVLARVPETRPAHHATHPTPGGPLTAFGDRLFAAFLAIQTLIGVIFFQGNVALPLDMRAHGVVPEQYGLLVAVNGVLIVLLQPLAVRWAPRYARSSMLALGALLTGAGFGLTGLAGGAPFYAFTIVVWTLGEIVLSPVAPAVVADLAPPERRGRYQGAYHMVFGFSSFAGPALGSLLMGHLGARAVWLGCLAGGLLAATLQLALARPLERRLRAPG